MHMSNQTVSNTDLHALAETLIKVFEGSPEEKLLLGVKYNATQELLLSGHPVAPAQLAARLRMSQDAVVALLRQIGVEWDAAGNVVGAGVSLTPTPQS